MNIVNKLTLRHLRLNRGRTTITVMGIILSVAMVCAVAGFVMSLQDLLHRTIMDSRGDYHIAYIGVTEETAYLIAEEAVFDTYYIKSSEADGLIDIFLRMKKPGRDYWEVALGITEKYSVQTTEANKELLALEGVISQDNVVRTFVTIATVCIIIIVTGSVIVISNAFYISASERVRQFGLLKSAGATKGQIGRSVLFEAFILAAIAIPLGILFGFLIQALVLYLVNDLMRDMFAINMPDTDFHVVFSPLIICFSVAVALFTIFISAWMPARRAAKTSPIDAIRQTKDIRIRSKQLKTSRLTQKLFGFEGTLGAKSLKRSKGKYRATVISLTASVVLFVSMSSFIWILEKDAQMQYGGYDFDVLVRVSGMDIGSMDEVDRILRSIPDAEIERHQRMLLTTKVTEGFYTERALEHFTETGIENPYNNTGIYLISMPDAEFAKIASAEPATPMKPIGSIESIEPTAPVTGEKITGILINTTGTIASGGRLHEYTPYVYKPGIELPLGFSDEGRETPDMSGNSISLVAEMQEIPSTIPSKLFPSEFISVLIPESVFRELYTSHEMDKFSIVFTAYAVTADDPPGFFDRAYEQLKDYREYVSIGNIAEITSANRNIILIIKLFGYGFIAMLSLIAITSVIATISTNMSLRKQEFAMLYSVGMTPEGMSKMLNFESLLYGFKSLIIGLPLGVALSFAMHKVMSNVAAFAWQPPWTSMGISVIAVMLLTFGTMRYSKGKLNKVSIVEAIRGETA